MDLTAEKRLRVRRQESRETRGEESPAPKYTQHNLPQYSQRKHRVPAGTRRISVRLNNWGFALVQEVVKRPHGVWEEGGC